MPYTPPSHRSPATSSPSSPVISRNQSYDASLHTADRPGLPRSRSATYLQKHRRSPSLAESLESPPADYTEANGYLSATHHHINGVSQHDYAQEPKAFAPFASIDGSTASPSESLGSEEEDENSRGRKLEDIATKLRETVSTRRGRSPPRTEEDSTPAAPRATPAVTTDAMQSPGLTPEARKISHSRSTSEIQLSKYANNDDVSPIQGSSEESDGEDELHIKPPLIRKKSGELVKPALRPGGNRRRPSSMPGTPTYSKAVHFNEDIEQVRHFLQVDRPIAVSAGSSPAGETYDSESEYPFNGKGPKSKAVEWEIRTSNFPKETFERSTQAVRLEKVFLSTDNTMLIGTVAVANISFQKWVAARFTLDYWKTTSEVGADFSNDKSPVDGFDRFNFNIRLADLANLESKTMLMCVRYNVDGREFWDNNNAQNYQIDFIKKVQVKSPKRAVVLPGAPTTTTSSAPALPRSRHSPLGRPKSFPAPDGDDFTRTFAFGQNAILGEDNTVIKLKANPRRGNFSFPQSRRTQSGGPHFSTRYDFGASLTAALNNAQTALGDQSGLKMKPTPPKPAAVVKPASAAPAVQPVEGTRPERFTTERPDLHSQEYNDLIQKFCYFGSGGKSSPASGLASPINEKGPASSNALKGPAPLQTSISVPDSNQSSPGGSPRSSMSNSPPSPRPQYDGSSDMPSMRSTTPPFHPVSPWLVPRSPSPGLNSSYQDYPFQGLSAQATPC